MIIVSGFQIQGQSKILESKKLARSITRLLTNKNDIEISFVSTDCGLLDSTTASEATRAGLEDGAPALLLLEGPGEERLALLSNHIVLIFAINITTTS